VLFRICAAVFRERNFGRRGVHNRYMGLGYTAKLLEQFYAPRDERDALIEEAGQLTRAITLESAAFLEQALALAQQIDPGERDRIERQTAVLALAVAAADRQMHARLDRLFERIDACAYRQLAATPPRRQRREGLWRSARRLAQALALAGLVGGGAAAIGACGNDRAVTDASNSDTNDIWPTDDAPHVIDDIWPTDDAPHSVLDTIWPTDDAPHPDGMVVDPAPPDMGPDAGGPKDAGVPQASLGSEPVDRWTDSGPRRTRRSPDLPLHDPPRPALRAERHGEALAVELCCDATVTARWEGDGRIELRPDDERRVLWTPECETDQLRVGVRSAGGVAVATLRALDVA
jgi:hypothetical protein